MYYDKPLKDMTAFEKTRRMLLTCAYSRGMWESVKVTQSIYVKVVQKKVRYYSELIAECYNVIKELKQVDMI